MIALLFVLSSTFFQELGSSIGKEEYVEGKESIYTMGFLGMIWSTLVFIFIAIFVRQGFLFSLESLPTFSIRALLEIAQFHVTMLAIGTADRSTFSFIRTGTIPLILIADLLIGYTLGIPQIAGIGVIIVALIVLLSNHGIRTKGMGLILFTTINAAVTISLFKYNITNFNSVEAEQSIIMGILLIYFFFMARFMAKENPPSFLKKPIFLAQSLSSGAGSVIMSFAYLFAPASIILTARRSFSLLWSILSGRIYFHEKHFAIKLFALSLIIGGLILMTL